jgi:hypothetical protein
MLIVAEIALEDYYKLRRISCGHKDGRCIKVEGTIKRILRSSQGGQRGIDHRPGEAFGSTSAHLTD